MGSTIQNKNENRDRTATDWSFLLSFPVLFVHLEMDGPDSLSNKIAGVWVGTDSMAARIDRSQLLDNRVSGFFSGPAVKVFHDAKKCLKQLKNYAGINLNNCADTMLLEQIIKNDFEREESAPGPELLIRRHIDAEIGPAGEPDDFVRLMFAVFLRQLELLKKHSLYDTAALECRAVPVYAAMELAGLPIDMEMWKANISTISAEYLSITEKLTFSLGLPRPENEQGFDDLVKKALLSGHHPLPDTKKETLLASGNTDALLFSRSRELRAMKNAWGTDFLRHLNPADGRIHADFTQIAAVSGRSSASNPNIQGIPKTVDFRRCICAPPGMAMVTADYSACELRILAEASSDPVFIRAFNDGRDLHSMVAESVFGKRTSRKENPELRAKAKVINFGLAYGMGARGLATQAGIPVPEAESLLERYFKAFPRIRDYLESSASDAIRRGYAVTLGGRRCTLPDPSTMPQQKLAELRRFCKNMPIQGTNADIVKTAMQGIMDGFNIRKVAGSIVNVVHDEILAEVPESCAYEAAKIVKTKMIEAGEYFVKKVPTEIECRIGKYWGDEQGQAI